MLDRIDLILGRTSGKQLERSSMITHLSCVFWRISTRVCDPMKPNPPGMRRVLNCGIGCG